MCEFHQEFHQEIKLKGLEGMKNRCEWLTRGDVAMNIGTSRIHSSRQ